MTPDRRAVLRLLGAAGATLIMNPPRARSAAPERIRRPIPSTGELLPVVGLGTYGVFDVAARAPEMTELRRVMSGFAGAGGGIVDTSPMYGRAEAAVGGLAEELAIRPRLFLATKVWARGREAGIRQMRESLRLLRVPRIDLMQVHNLLDVPTHAGTLREWKRAGTVRYLGITHYQSGAYAELERLLLTRDYDFVQLNYSLAERDAEARLLDAAAQNGAAVIVNRPFAEGALFAKVRGMPLPPWAADFDCGSWAQFFLKYVLGHPAVTCTIPGTGKVAHLIDNLQASAGRLPDARQRRRMAELIRDS